MFTSAITGRRLSASADTHAGPGTVNTRFLLPLLLFFCAGQAFAAGDLIADYDFDGNFDDSAGGSTILVHPECPGDPCNSVSAFGSDADGTYWQWETTNLSGGGFSITTATDFGDSYTIRLKFSFDNVSSYRKIIDFGDRALDTGLYFYDGALELYLYNDPRSDSFDAGEILDLLLVRSGATDQFTAYLEVDGTYEEIYQTIDEHGYGIPISDSGGRLLGFFFDDEATSGEATSGGKIYALQIWLPTLFSDRFESK